MTELYLIAPADAEAGALAERLTPMLATATIAALLLPRGQRTAETYASFVRSIAPLAQAAGAAVLLEGRPEIVRELGGDGLHVEGSVAAVKAAMAVLKPDYIVGAGPVASRDEAMTAGELGLDYIMFGPFSGAIAAADREMAAWWAETMEVPGVLSDPQTIAAEANAAGCEFLALSDSVWTAADPAALLADIAARLEHRS